MTKTKMYTIQRFKEGGIAIHTSTKELRDKALRTLDKSNITWMNGYKPTKKEWIEWRDSEECFACMEREGKMFLFHCDKRFYENLEYEIIFPHQLKTEEEPMKEKLSNCCNAPVKLDFSDDFREGDSGKGCTCCCMCTKCGKPCDIAIDDETEGSEPTNNIIDTPEKFKNKYIDLSNTKLNGEMTEERFERLGKCFKNIGCTTYGWSYHHFDSLKFMGSHKCRFVDMEGNNVSNGRSWKDNHKQISCFDILGFDGGQETEETRVRVKNIIIKNTQNVTLELCTRFDAVNIKRGDETFTINFENFSLIKEFLESIENYKKSIDNLKITLEHNGGGDWKNTDYRYQGTLFEEGS